MYGPSICTKLTLTTDQLNALYTNCPVGGYLGVDVATELHARYGIPYDEPLGAGLAALGVLTEPEGEWFDDVD